MARKDMRGSRITSIAFHVPDRLVTNYDLERMIDTSDEWIVQRTGIKQRHWVEGDVGASELALPASIEALEKAGLKASDLDMIIFATLSPDITFPGSACILQAKLGCPGIAALDISNQCTGFIYSLSVADQFIRTGSMNRILVVGAEVHSSGLDISNKGRDVTVLFGDGAGAVLIEATEGDSRIIDTRLHADGRYLDILKIVAPASKLNPRVTHEMLDKGLQYPYMEGRAVFKQAIARLPQVINEILDANGYSVSDVDLLVPHQANLRINEMVIGIMGIPRSKMVSNIDRYGNTTAASIPIALCEAVEDGRLKSGDLVLLAAFGAGLTWGAGLVRW